MATIFNEQRVLGVRIVSDGTVLHNNQPVIGVVEVGRNTPFVGNERTLGIDVLGVDAPIYNEQPVIGAVPISDGRELYNNRKVLPVSSALADYDFRSGSYYGPALTCVRASSAYVEDLAGNWTLVPANTLRRSNKGVLVEESRTNSIRNNAMQGAVVGTPGTLPTGWYTYTNVTGLTRSVIGTGTESGIDYIDIRIFGTPSGSGIYDIGPVISSIVAASTGQTWAMSVFATLAGGTTAGIGSMYLTFLEYAPSNVYVTEGSVSVGLPTSDSLGVKRYSSTRTLSGGATVSNLISLTRLNLSGAPIDITLRIGWPQLEQGAFATSPIRTTGTAATRAADVITAPLSFGPAFTMIGIGRAPALSSTVNRVFARGTLAGANKYMAFIDTSNNLVSGEPGDNSVFIASGLAAGARFCFAASGDVSGRSLSINGGALATGAGYTSSHDLLSIGDGGSWNGFIERLIVLPYRATNADVQRLSQLSTWGG